MKKFLKSFCALALFFCLLATVSCGGGIDIGNAKTLIGDCLDKIADGDISGASDCLHPDVPLQLESYLEDVEREWGISFADGLVIERQTGVRYAYYDSEFGGSYYGQAFRGKVGNTEVYIQVTVVQNKAGYGVYDLEIII